MYSEGKGDTIKLNGLLMGYLENKECNSVSGEWNLDYNLRLKKRSLIK